MNTEHQNADQWKYAIEIVTPSRASDILARCNWGNRPLRPGVVAKYVKIIESGNWRLSPEAIVISDTGRLLNGQHRLSAVAKSNASVNFLFIYGPNETTFEVLDRGAGRSIADALCANKKATEVARLACTMEVGQANKVADYDVRAMISLIGDEHEALMGACNSVRPVFSSAAFRLAAIARIKAGSDRDWVHCLYRSIVLGHTDELPPIGHAAMRMRLSGSLAGTSDGGSLQARMVTVGWELFDYAKLRNTRILPKQYADIKCEILEAIKNAKP